MSSKDSNTTTGLERFGALFAWWGVPNAPGKGAIDTQMKRFQTFAADLQKTYGDAYSQQMQALFTANERLVRSLQEFIHCRQPEDIVAAESHVLATLLEGASSQTKTWIELTQKVEACCAAMARDVAAEVGQQAPAKEESQQPAHA
jgi:hypothetical protein